MKRAPKKWSGKLDRRVLSSDSSDTETKMKIKTKRPSKVAKQVDKKRGIDVWCEVYLEAEEKWFCVDVPKKKVHCCADLYVRSDLKIPNTDLSPDIHNSKSIHFICCCGHSDVKTQPSELATYVLQFQRPLPFPPM